MRSTMNACKAATDSNDTEMHENKIFQKKRIIGRAQ